MNWIPSILIVLGLLFPLPCRADDKPTRLYVRTDPTGANVWVDDKAVGKSDELFVVKPGMSTIKVELLGYQTVIRSLDLKPGQITRLELKLSAASPVKVAAEAKMSDAAQAATAYLERTELPASVRTAMMAAVRQHPSETRWSDRHGTLVFAVASKKIPVGPLREQAIPPLMELTHSLAVTEMLTAKGLLDRYTEYGLTDATALRQAMVRVSATLQISGEVKSFKHLATAQGDFVIAYVLAEADQLNAQMAKPVELERVKDAYRDAIHVQARDLMARENWNDALLAWQHLHQRKLVSPALYLDAALCLMKTGKPNDATRLLQEAFDAFQESATASFLEKAGDMALEIGDPAALKIAERAYRSASQKLMNTVTQPPTTVGKPSVK